MSYIGNNLQTAFPSYLNIDDISGSFDGVTTSFPLTVGGVAPVPAPLSSNQCLISVGGVVQRPDDSGTEGFLLSGGNIVFSAAPAALDDFFGVILAGADYVNVGVNFPSGTATTPSITFDTDLDTGIYNPGANEIGFTTAGVNRVTINSSGNVSIVNDLTVDTNTLHVDSTNNRVGIGTSSPTESLEVVGNAILDASNATLKIKQGATGTTGAINFTFNSDSTSYGSLNLDYNSRNTQGLRLNTLYPLTLECGAAEQIVFKRATTENARIDSSGRLLVGTSSASVSSTIVCQGNSGSSSGEGIVRLNRGTAVPTSGQTLGAIVFGQSVGNDGAYILGEADAAWSASNDYPTRLVFSTTADGASSPTERMRISSVGTTSTCNTNGAAALVAGSTQAASTTASLIAGVHSRTDNTTGGTTSFLVYTNGNVENTNNSYGSLSDIKLKENIVNANSQWDDIKALRVRKYNLKEETGQQTHTQIGLIAQEVELVSPGLVSESPDRDAEGNDLGTVTKSVNYSVLYMKAVKALQEAMERIETLEAKVAALESA